MSQLTAIDADGHVIEKESEIRKYLKAPWNQRSTALRPGDQPWDNYMFDHFVTERTWSRLSAREQVERWQDILDEHQIETAVCFPTGSGSVVRLQELKFQIAVAQACNDHFAAEYNALSDRVKCVGVLPLRSPQACASCCSRVSSRSKVWRKASKSDAKASPRPCLSISALAVSRSLPAIAR